MTDKTCCVHAEQRAIMDALRKNPEKLSGSRLYFIRLDDNRTPSRAGEPYCTICSKMALDVGIAEFVLWLIKEFVSMIQKSITCFLFSLELTGRIQLFFIQSSNSRLRGNFFLLHKF